MQESASFYANLYLPTTEYTPEDLAGYLNGINFPQLTGEQRRALDAQLILEELQTAVPEFPNCKAPGEDGLPMETYKQYAGVLLPKLLAVFNAARERQVLPPFYVQSQHRVNFKTW